ncbi:hypothetical protein Y032_0506g2679 [Ancylostoma ceylanicum]|uniref:Uncharacterized protein n=1 Tax=Ancylostoma ceylanicum TaxID=53326 RepID=A0A016WTR3_9BILA|nr:hypothetical protein Y032_0506g2679 [Ancylostoma ceylanicum]
MKFHRREYFHKATPIDHLDPDKVMRRGFQSYPFESRWNPFLGRDNFPSNDHHSEIPRNSHGHFTDIRFFSRPPFKFLSSRGGVDYVYLGRGIPQDATRFKHRITGHLTDFD